MTKHYCDICGNETTESYYFITVTYSGKLTYGGKLDTPTMLGGKVLGLGYSERIFGEKKEKQICPKCYSKMKDCVKDYIKGL